MFELIKAWFQRYFSEPEAGILLLALLFAMAFIVLLGNLFAPVLIALAIAYLLDVVISFLHNRLCLPRWVGFVSVYFLFIALLLLVLLVFLPLLSKQIAQVIGDIPRMLEASHDFLATLPERYPYISGQMVDDLIQSTSFNAEKLSAIGRAVFSVSLASIPSVVTWLVYLFLVPLMVLFFLKDKTQLLDWTQGYMPSRRGLLIEVCQEMKHQLGNYLKGKAMEMLIVGVVSYVCFIAFGLNYAALLAFLVALSVLIPYIGMVIVTIPIVVIGLLQWGMTPHFMYMLLVYLIIQALDGNVLVPLLFSEAVNLHPIAIIVAVLFFGGIWGFWGLFFAIPLATLVKAVFSAWSGHVAKHQGAA